METILMFEKYSHCEFKVEKCEDDKWIYIIHCNEFSPDGIVYSQEGFDSKQEARFAAIGHIYLIENGDFCHD